MNLLSDIMTGKSLEGPQQKEQKGISAANPRRTFSSNGKMIPYVTVELHLLDYI
jgi:hypothetical protein